MGKVCTRFRNRKNRRKNHTRWGGKYLYGLYKGVPPPPPGASKEEQDKPARQQVISETLIWRNHIYDVVILRPTFVAPFSDHLGFKSIYVATLRLPPIVINSRRPSLSICETKVAERGTRLFQSHFVMSVFHWNYTQKEFVLRVWIVPGDVSGDQWPIDCR